MPMYDYKCQSCGDQFKEMLSIADRKVPCESPCRNCGGEVRQQLGFAAICDPIRMGITKPSAGFNEVLRTIKAGNPNSTVRVRD